MRTFKLTPEERKIEDDIISGRYQKVPRSELNTIVQVINARKKDAVMNIRVNSQDLESIKKKAKSMGVKYQTFLSEFIHKLAQS